MKTLQTIAISMFIVFSGTTAATAQENEVAAIRALLEPVATSMQAGDMAALDAVYAPGGGVHIIEGTGVNHGWIDYRDNHLGPELAAFENFTIRYFAIEPQVRGDVAYSAFRYELSADMNGEHIEIEGRGTAILERMAGQWKIVHTHTSGRRK